MSEFGTRCLIRGDRPLVEGQAQIRQVWVVLAALPSPASVVILGEHSVIRMTYHAEERRFGPVLSNPARCGPMAGIDDAAPGAGHDARSSILADVDEHGPHWIAPSGCERGLERSTL